MPLLIISIVSLCVLGIILSAGRILKRGQSGTNAGNSCSTCGGTAGKCSKDCMMEAAIKEIEYYDDEELDAFTGRPSNGYEQKEIEMFSDILYTMRQDDIAGWCRSLTLRGISLPDELKDEVVMMMNDGNS